MRQHLAFLKLWFAMPNFMAEDMNANLFRKWLDEIVSRMIVVWFFFFLPEFSIFYFLLKDVLSFDFAQFFFQF